MPFSEISVLFSSKLIDNFSNSIVNFLLLKYCCYRVSFQKNIRFIDSVLNELARPFFLFCYDSKISVKLICVIRKNDIQLRLKDPLALNKNYLHLDSQL